MSYINNERGTGMKVRSAHTGHVIELSELERNGGVVEKINEKLLRVEFPTKDGVGSIGGFWRIEPEKQK